MANASKSWDDLVPGLHVRVSVKRSFYVRYRSNGSQRRMKLGAYPALSLSDARKRAREVLADVALGNDPAQAKREAKDQDVTFAALGREVLEAKAPRTRPKTQRDRQWIFESKLLPLWGKRPAASIGRREILRYIEDVAKETPVLARHVLELVNVVYNEGLVRGFPGLDANPAHMLRAPVPIATRERFLSAVEIKTLWKLLEGEYATTAALFRLNLLTGQRIGATMALRWDDMNGAHIWRTPATWFKGKRDHLTPLSTQALDVLEAVRPHSGDDEFVFPGRGGGRPRNSVNKALQRLQRDSQLPHCTVHDFRRTFRTHATRAAEDGGLGIAPNVADAVLGHKEASLGFDRYTGEPERYLLHEKREALAKWGTFVQGAVQ
ncbi:MAG: DUF4102 domain-containing protein [Gemmatimonas sp.]|nr:DUF4102 domain-containing protein [Gemmatimonas sp.]